MVNLRRKQALKIHPLLIDHVVEKILKHAGTSPSDFLSFRSVCKLWHAISTKQYKSQEQVEVGSYTTTVPKLRKLIQLHSSRPSLNWPSPFAKFRLCQEVFQPIYITVLTEFFQTFENELESLDIWLDLRSTFTDLSLRRESSLCFVNLKTLVYDDRRVILEGQDEKRGILLSKLVQLAPNLQTLSIRFQRDFRGSVEYSRGPLYETIQDIFSQKNLQKSLKYLKLDIHIDDKLLDCLVRSKIPLNSLEVAIRGSVFSYGAFHTFLESLSRTLTCLKFSYIERDSRCLLSFPKMSALRKLEIDGTDGFSKHSVSFCDFTYKNNLPRLETLKINIWAMSYLKWGQFFPLKSPEVMTLSALKLPGELCDKSVINCVSDRFPNLKKLHVSVYSLTLYVIQVIFERLNGLEELTITKFPTHWDRSERNIDDILTGLSEQDCDKLWRENINLEGMDEEDIKFLKRRKGLSDLKCLKRLEMPDLQYQASYSDVTGYFAFHRMPNLKYLNAGRSYMSPTCLTSLSKRFPEMEAQRLLPSVYLKGQEEDDDDTSYLELPGDTCVYL